MEPMTPEQEAVARSAMAQVAAVAYDRLKELFAEDLALMFSKEPSGALLASMAIQEIERSRARLVAIAAKVAHARWGHGDKCPAWDGRGPCDCPAGPHNALVDDVQRLSRGDQ